MGPPGAGGHAVSVCSQLLLELCCGWTPLRRTVAWSSGCLRLQATVAHPSWNTPRTFCSANAITSPFRSSEMGGSVLGHPIPLPLSLRGPRCFRGGGPPPLPPIRGEGGTVFTVPSCASVTASWGDTSSLCLGSGSATFGEGLFWEGRDALSCCLSGTTQRMLFEVRRVFTKARAAVTALSSGVSSCKWFSSPSSVASFPRHTLRTLSTCFDDVRIWKQWGGRRIRPAGPSMSGPWDVNMFASQLPMRGFIALGWSGS